MKDSDYSSRPRIKWLFVSIPMPIFILALTFISGNATAKMGTADGGTINAVLVRSWNNCNSTSTIWESLNNNWPNYGTTPIYIDYTNNDLCGGTITYNNLVASGADVVILSDPAGGGEQYTPTEIADLETYAQEGHNFIGTFLLLQFDPTDTDNRELAPIFGLEASGNYTSTTTPLTPTYNFLEPNFPIFNNMGASYTSGGYPFYQIPTNDGTWDNNDLAGARYIAKTADDAAVITVYDTPTYSAIFIANMPEYQSGAIDERFIYNAITYQAKWKVILPIIVN